MQWSSRRQLDIERGLNLRVAEKTGDAPEPFGPVGGLFRVAAGRTAARLRLAEALLAEHGAGRILDQVTSKMGNSWRNEEGGGEGRWTRGTRRLCMQF